MKLSVAICTYNGAAFLRKQLQSIGTQTRPPDEVVACDDCSTDSSVAILQDFAASTNFPVRIFVNEQNLGSTTNFEQAIGLCEGDIIALGDQDDVWLSNKLDRLVEVFSSSPNCGLVFSDAEIVDDQLNSTGHTLWERIEFDTYQQEKVQKGQALNVLLPGWFVTGATAAFASRYRDLILPLPKDLPLIHDGWIGAVLAAVSEVRIISAPLILYRQHSQQQVGAPAGLPTHDVSVSASLARTNPYTEQLAITETVLERITGQSKFPVEPEAIRTLTERIAHLKARSDLPMDKFRRLKHIASELAAGRYHRYSKGLRSAMKDLVN